MHWWIFVPHGSELLPEPDLRTWTYPPGSTLPSDWEPKQGLVTVESAQQLDGQEQVCPCILLQKSTADVYSMVFQYHTDIVEATGWSSRIFPAC